MRGDKGKPPTPKPPPPPPTPKPPQKIEKREGIRVPPPPRKGG
jgi:hypothetical protein